MLDPVETRDRPVHAVCVAGTGRAGPAGRSRAQGASEAQHGVADLLATMSSGLGRHMTMQEQMLFPNSQNGGHPTVIADPVAAMFAEHNDVPRPLA